MNMSINGFQRIVFKGTDKIPQVPTNLNSTALQQPKADTFEKTSQKDSKPKYTTTDIFCYLLLIILINIKQLALFDFAQVQPYLG